MAHPFKKKYKLTYKRTIVDFPGVSQGTMIIQLDNGFWTTREEFLTAESLIRTYESQGIVLIDAPTGQTGRVTHLPDILSSEIESPSFMPEITQEDEEYVAQRNADMAHTLLTNTED